jgi:hypothetical protein
MMEQWRARRERILKGEDARTQLAPHEPVSVAWLARSSRNHVLYHDSHNGQHHEVADGFSLLPYPLPDCLMTVVDPGAAHILINDRLTGQDANPLDMPIQQLIALYHQAALGAGAPVMERLIDKSIPARVAVALSWLRWHQWPALAAAALGIEVERVLDLPRLATSGAPESLTHPYAVGWAVATSPHIRQQVWPNGDTRHAHIYSHLWRALGQLLAPRQRLDAVSRIILGLDQYTVPEAVRPLEDRMPLVWQMGHARGAPSREAAEALYIADLADALRVPRVLVRSRLEGDWEIASLDVWRQVSDALVTEHGQLTAWRLRMAEQARCAPVDVVLMLHEPALTLADTDGRMLLDLVGPFGRVGGALGEMGRPAPPTRPVLPQGMPPQGGAPQGMRYDARPDQRQPAPPAPRPDPRGAVTPRIVPVYHEPYHEPYQEPPNPTSDWMR